MKIVILSLLVLLQACQVVPKVPLENKPHQPSDIGVSAAIFKIVLHNSGYDHASNWFQPEF